MRLANDWRLLRPQDVAERLQVSRRMIYSLIARGDLRSCRVGGAIRIHPDDLADYLDQLRRRVNQPPDERPAEDDRGAKRDVHKPASC